MIRGYAIASFVYVQRIFSIIFYHLGIVGSGPDIFILSGILGVGLNWAIANWWINRTRVVNRKATAKYMI
jgi:hypothetical protein